MLDRGELFRYIINGFLATIIHFSVLTFNLKVFEFHSAGLANMLAACFGITASFVGSRFFVFNKRNEHIAKQALKFVILYAAIAGIHGVVLFIWSDLYKFDYRSGFLLATFFQVVFSYIGNKILVFKS